MIATAIAKVAIGETPIVEALSDFIGAPNVLTDHDNCRFYSSDIVRGGEVPIAVVLPGLAAE
jgi:hypothetical protein